MAKQAVYDYSTTASSNSDFDGTDSSGATGKVKDGDNYARSIASHIKGFANDLGGINTVAGTGDAITITLSSAPSALVDGMRLTFNASAANTTNVTLNVTPAGGAAFGSKKVLKWAAGVETALSANDIPAANALIELIYDTARDTAAGAWMLLGTSVPNPLSLSGSSVSYTPIQLTSTEAGAAEGPIVEVYRDSASPLAGDLTSHLYFYGRDSAGNKQLYGKLGLRIGDPTSTTEVGLIDFYTVSAGSTARSMTVGAGLVIGSGVADLGAGKLNVQTSYNLNGSFGVIGMGTLSTATGGTAISYTSVIPSGAKRFTLSWSGLSTSGSSIPIVQLGVGGTYQTTTYLGSTARVTTATASSFQWNTGVPLDTTWTGTNVFGGCVVGNLIDAATGTWELTMSAGHSSSVTQEWGAGSKVLSGTLDSVRLTMVNGTDTFDANTGVNLTWE